METENLIGVQHSNAYTEHHKKKNEKQSLWALIKDDLMSCEVGESFFVPFSSDSKLIQIRNCISLRSKELNKSFITKKIAADEVEVTRIEKRLTNQNDVWAFIKDQFLSCAIGQSFEVELTNGLTEQKLRSVVSFQSKQHSLKYSVRKIYHGLYRLARLDLIEPNPVNHFPAWLEYRFTSTPKESYTLLELAEAFQAGVTTGAAK